MGTKVASMFWLFSVVVLSTFCSWLTFKESFCCFLDVYSGMECTDGTESLPVVLGGAFILFCTVAVPVVISNSIWGLPIPHILENISFGRLSDVSHSDICEVISHGFLKVFFSNS